VNAINTSSIPTQSAVAATSDTRLLTEAVTGLRRALRASIRTEYPWETLPIAQVEILQSLAEAEPARAGELAERLHLAPNTVSGLISRLMAAGLVDRRTDATDRRASVVQLTEQGRERLASWQDAHERRIGAALDELSPEHRAALGAALPAMAELVARLHIDATSGGHRAAPDSADHGR
jgi:DNA-binding MarR family transcriptional regulator